VVAAPEEFDREELEAWLRGQPREVSLVLASRSALRVFPQIGGASGRQNFHRAILLPVFRASSLAFSYIYMSEISQKKLVAAALSTAAQAAADVTYAATDATASIRAAANAAYATFYPANTTATQAIYAATRSTNVAYDGLYFDRGEIKAEVLEGELATRPLWPNRQMPNELARHWEALKSQLLSTNEDWDVWTTWYEDRLEGRPPEDEALAVARVTLPEPMWQEGPKTVNSEIKHLKVLFDKDGPEAVEARMAELRKQYPENDKRHLTMKAEPGQFDIEGSDADLNPQHDLSIDKLPRAWILQYAPDDRVARWTAEATPGSTLRWKSGKALPKDMQAGDPVVYWRAIDPDNREDRGGLVGRGTVISTETEDEDGILRFPTRVEIFDEDNRIERDEVIRAAGITRRNWRGAVLALRPEETERLDGVLKEHGWPGLIPDDDPIPPEPPRAREFHETDFVSDRPETAKDLLNRASLAFALAAHVNRIWTAQTANSRIKTLWRKCLDCYHFERFNRQTREQDDAAFILHIDAPWGGGKTTFANFLARILNPAAHGHDPDSNAKTGNALLDDLPLKDPRYWDPKFSKRRWFVVDFNAWRNEHVSPPWWNFYEVIRQQCMKEILFEPGRYETSWVSWKWLNWINVAVTGLKRGCNWLRFWVIERIWRIATPEMGRTLLFIAVLALLIYWITGMEWFENLSQAKNDAPYAPVIKGLLGVAATGGAGLAIINAFRSGLQTIIKSAGSSTNAASLGTSDPIHRFRRHFSWFTEQLDHPVMVIIDDLDRCTPKYVVELVRGLMTIFQSPRVVFVLLGDKDWIETAFAKVHKEMAEVHKDAQITFGGRFAEKAIQLSFVLPEADADAREAYLSAILQAEDTPAAPQAKEVVLELENLQEKVRFELAGTDRLAEQEAAVARSETLIEDTISKAAPARRDELRKASQTILNRERMLRTATARSAETEIRSHGLAPLKQFLPGNPRRIKRIVNMVSAYQASAQSTEGIAPGSDKWKQLVIWVVIMSEYPQIWRELVTDPSIAAELFEQIKLSGDKETVVLPPLDDGASEADKNRYEELTLLLLTPGLVPLLRGDPFAEEGKDISVARIDMDARGWLRRLTPID
jgi:hypothetical protein